MKVVILFLWLSQGLFISSQVFAISAAPPDKIEYVRAYGGNCLVRHEQDLITDQVTHLLRCYASVGKPENVGVIINANLSDDAPSEGATGSIIFHGYDQDHQKSAIDVMFRVDQNSTYNSSWFTNLMFTEDEEVFKYAYMGLYFPGHKYYHSSYTRFLANFLDSLARGQNLYTKVGDRSVTIPLQGAAAAVDDFESRITYLK